MRRCRKTLNGTGMCSVVTVKLPGLSPVTPDRSVVVCPESVLKIESGARTLFYVLLPVWITVSVGSQKKHPLDEFPGKVLSDTWFGEPHEGECSENMNAPSSSVITALLPAGRP